MAKMILGVFTERDDADRAVDDLGDAGYKVEDISVIMKRKEGEKGGMAAGAPIAEGTISGATTGGVIGGIAGLLIGIGAIAIPGIGAILIGGPIAAAIGLTGAAAATVSGAITGALAGGLIGALGSLGLSEEDARMYERRVREGGILLAVPVRENNQDDVRRILEENNADQIKVVSAEF